MKLLFYTGSFTHQFYKEQYKFFPENIDLIPSTPELINQTILRKDYTSRFTFLKKLIRKTGFFIVKFFKIPKYYKIDSKDCDMIYAAQYLLKNNLPYVSDFEHIAAYSWYSQKLFDSPSFQKKLKKIFMNPNLKFLLPWTEAAKQTLMENMDCSDFKHKIKVVYPAIKEKKFKKIAHKGINILFIGGNFYLKGGMDSIFAFLEVKKEFPNIKFTIVSNNIPEEIIEEYKNKVIFKSKISQKELDKEYRNSDIFLLPTHMDTFGFVFLEAMSYGLPCIGIKNFAVPEIITDNETGFVVENSNYLYDEKFKYKYDLSTDKENEIFTSLCMTPTDLDIANLAHALKKLVADKKLRKRMSNNCLKEIKTGKFSKTRRIKELKNYLVK